MKKKWSDYLWIASLTYLILGFFNILFAWLGLICFIVPIVISLVTGSKAYCHICPAAALPPHGSAPRDSATDSWPFLWSCSGRCFSIPRWSLRAPGICARW